jgi:hypothetical protein
MRNSLTSRQRMLAAIDLKDVDHVPCCFMLFKGLLSSSRSYIEFIERQIELGLDTFVQIPARPPKLVSDSYNLHGLPVSYHPSVRIKEWIEHLRDEKWPVLFKTYETPVGGLQAEVYQDDDWPYGNHIPFLDDYIESRSRKFLLDGPDDLPALRYLLMPPFPPEIAEFHSESIPLLDFARQHNLLVAGGWGVGADLIGWVYGLERMMYASYDYPDFILELLEVISEWNQSRMKVVLDMDIDLYIKRAWYENCDFWAPKTWRKFIFPILKSDVELAHKHGVRFGYLITANCLPLLEMIADAGVDVIIGVDPAQWDLAIAKQKLAGRVCLWGGVNGHLTMEQGTPEEVKAEVQKALELLAPGGGFILSPVDNVRELTEVSQRNIQSLISEWRYFTDL